MSGAIEMYRRSVEDFGQRVMAIGPDDWARPTPCREWRASGGSWRSSLSAMFRVREQRSDVVLDMAGTSTNRTDSSASGLTPIRLSTNVESRLSESSCRSTSVAGASIATAAASMQAAAATTSNDRMLSAQTRTSFRRAPDPARPSLRR